MKSYVAMVASVLLLCPASWSGALADEFKTSIPMRHGGAATYYVTGQIGDLAEMDFMVDTGSGFLTINETTLELLKSNNQVRYLRNLRGILANGNQMLVPVYRISELNIGGNCSLRDVEAAVFPGTTRQILGLSALKKASPFIFSVDPPNLVLSHCPRAEIASAQQAEG